MHTVNSTIEDLNDGTEEFGSPDVVIRENGTVTCIWSYPNRKIVLTAKEHED